MITLQQVLATPGKENLEAVSSLYRSAFFCAQRLISLNIKATQSIMDGNVSVIQALINARNPSVWNATQTVMMQRFIDRIVCYAGDFNEVVAENQQELSRLLEVRGESSDNASEFMLTAAPKMMVKVVQSMLDAAVESRKSMLDVAQLVRFARRRQSACKGAQAKGRAAQNGLAGQTADREGQHQVRVARGVRGGQFACRKLD